MGKEEGDIAREYKAMHEEKFLSSWLRKDVEGIEERREDREHKVREDESRSGRRKVEREEKTVGVKRKNLVPWMIRKVSGILHTFLVVFLSVSLRFRWVCLL